MSKYYLVASYYNQKTKKYELETIIKSLKGTSLDTLYDIDLMTTSYPLTELIKTIEEETKKEGFNHLAIKYIKNNYR